MFLHNHKKIKKEERITKRNSEMSKFAINLAGKNVGCRNPMSRGQGYTGETRVAILNMLKDDSDNSHR